MLQRFLRRDHDDPYLEIHSTPQSASLYDDAAPVSFLQQNRNRLIAGTAVALLLGVFLFGGGSPDGASIPVISPPTPTTRIKPADPQGLDLPHQDMQVYSYVDPNGVPQPRVERLIPAPQETPRLPSKPAAPTVTVAPAPAPAPAATAPITSVEQPPVVTQPVTQSAPQVVRSLPQPVTPVVPAQPPAIVPAYPQTGSGTVGTPAAPAPQAQPGIPAVTAPAGGPFRLQLGSLRDMAAAQQHWKTAQTRGGGILSGMQPQVLKVEIPGKGTYFRVQAGSWPTRQDAQQACETLKQARVDCMVIR